MERQDGGMPFLLKYENVAWYENGKVRILDRRVFPTERKFVECTTYHEVVQAIADMVTQSAGPYTAVGMGMALAAYECREKPLEQQKEFLKQASYDLAHSRPTTANRYGIITERCAELGIEALERGEDPIQPIVDSTIESLNRRYSTMQLVGDRLVELIPENGTILTQCYGETIIGAMIRASKKQNKPFKVFCAETRPYLQGARLTSSCFAEMGFDTTVITDNMVAFAIQNQGIDLSPPRRIRSHATDTSRTRSEPSRSRSSVSTSESRTSSRAFRTRESIRAMTSRSRCVILSRCCSTAASRTRWKM